MSFESFLRTEIDWVESDIKLVFDEYFLSFTTYKIQTGIYIFKDHSEALSRIPQPEYELCNDSVDFKFDDITMKTKLFLRPGNIGTRFDEKTFF